FFVAGLISFVYARLFAIRAGQSIVICEFNPLFVNNSAFFLASTAVYKIFFGSQPRLGHVPPQRSSSTSATFCPLLLIADAAAVPAGPAPITTASYFFANCSMFSLSLIFVLT